MRHKVMLYKLRSLQGYSDGYATKAIIEGLKDEIFEATKSYMARLGPKAAVAYGSALVDPTQLGIKEKDGCSRTDT